MTARKLNGISTHRRDDCRTVLSVSLVRTTATATIINNNNLSRSVRGVHRCPTRTGHWFFRKGIARAVVGVRPERRPCARARRRRRPRLLKRVCVRETLEIDSPRTVRSCQNFVDVYYVKRAAKFDERNIPIIVRRDVLRQISLTTTHGNVSGATRRFPDHRPHKSSKGVCCLPREPSIIRR